MVSSKRTVIQLKMILSLFKNNEINGSYVMMNKLLENYFKWKKKLTLINKNNNEGFNKNKKIGNTEVKRNIENNQRQGRSAPMNKRRRMRGGKMGTTNNYIQTHISGSNESIIKIEDNEQDEQKKTNEEEEEENMNDFLFFEMGIKKEDIEEDELLEEEKEIIIMEYNNINFNSSKNIYDDFSILNEIHPQYVIIYDPNLNFIRNLEVYSASVKSEMVPKVYMMIYDNSIEEQRYLSHIRRENFAFKKLIREKSIMSIPIDQDGRVKLQPEDEFWTNINTRIAGGQIEKAYQKQVIVDVREFRCSLPLLIHAKQMNVKPCTLVVGDYILSPKHCVERKSISDLIQSFKSGRLYTQVESMTHYYKQPILLIEFNQDKSFLLQSVNHTEISVDDIQSKLVLLLLAFPNLKIFWASSPYASADMFIDVKKDEEEPNMEEAMSIGIEKNEYSKQKYNRTPQDMLLSIPGVTYKNYKIIMNNVKNMQELCEMKKEDLSKLVGIESARLIYNFFNDKKTEIH